MLAIVLLIASIWALVGIVRAKEMPGFHRCVFALVVIFFPFIGAVAWLIYAAKRAAREEEALSSL
jgi:hypothetical protein